MKDLTNTQFNQLKSLAKNPLISQVSIDILGSDLLRIAIISHLDADFNEVDKLIEDIFPGKEYRGSVGEESEGDFYSIDVEGETMINLLMKKTAVWSAKDILGREG